MLPLSHPRAWIAGACLIAGVIVIGSLLPGPVVSTIGVNDKVEHVGAYFGLTIWLVGIVEPRHYLKAAVVAALLGGGMEIAQALFTTTRDPDWLDFVADSVGAAVALAVAWLGIGGWAGRLERWLGAVPPD